MQKTSGIRKRNQRGRPNGRGPVPDRWDLSTLLREPVVHFESFLGDLNKEVSRFEAWRTSLSPSMPADQFMEMLQLNETIVRQCSALGAYAYLWFSENTADLKARAFKTKAEEALTALQNRLLFFELWWQSIEESDALRLMHHAGDFRYHLETIRRFKPHTLTEPEEQIINIKNVTGRASIRTLYDVVTNGFTFSLRAGGRTRTLTREALMAYLRHPQASVRQAAYQELYRVYAAHHDLLGEVYKALVNDWKAEQLQLRHFSSPIASRNLGNDIPDPAVDALLKVCVENRGIFQHYFAVKARLCKIRPMSRYHIYAPHRAERKRYRYADAVRMVLEAYRGFSPQLADLAERVFAERHIDAQTRPGKMAGAYCYSITPDMTPYVHLNYTGEARDIATMAHELGHAVHGMLAAHHTVFTFQSTLPLAETASVFGERILSDALMKQESNRHVKQALLLAQLDDIYATVMRQAHFIVFEQRAHDMVSAGATVTDLAEAYQTTLKEQFGKAVRIPPEFKWEWLTIPHIFASPFYCYAYSFGNLLVLALYRMYQEQGAEFVPRYLNVLATGGSKAPQEILGDVGIDMTATAFWQSGFRAIEDMVNQLETLA